MVSFICDACGHTVKKNRVEKHYQSECRNCSVMSCIDCGKDFPGESYAQHTSCITEAEKYQGKLYKPKEKGSKGETKQQEWIKQVQLASSCISDPKLKGYMKRISDYPNVPRKKGKFENFCKNSLCVYDQKIVEKLWELFSSQQGKQAPPEQVSETTAKETASNSESSTIRNGDSFESEDQETKKKDKKSKKKKKDMNKDDETIKNLNGDEVKEETNDAIDNKKKKKKKRKGDEDDKSLETKRKKPTEDNETSIAEEIVGSEESSATTVNRGKFDWKKVIMEVLKNAPEEGISIKRLRKKVLGEYEAFGQDHRATSKVDCYALFDKKLYGCPKAKFVKDRVIYRK